MKIAQNAADAVALAESLKPDLILMDLSMPLLDGGGEVRGVVAVALSVEWLVRDLQGLALPPGSSATIADREGVVLARSLDPERFVGRPMAPFAMELMRRSEPGIIDAPALDAASRWPGSWPGAARCARWRPCR